MPGLLERIDKAIAELVELRTEVAAALPPPAGNGLDETDDLASDSLLDTCAASARFGYPQDTVLTPLIAYQLDGSGQKQASARRDARMAGSQARAADHVRGDR